MTALVSLPAIAIEPTVSEPLAWAIDDAIQPPHPDAGEPPVHLRPELRPEAERAHDWLTSLCLPVDAQRLDAWLVPFIAACGGAMPREDYRARFAVIAAAVHSLPRGCFTAETQRDGLRKFRFFPTPAEICELVEPTRKRLLARRNALAKLLRIPPEEPHPVVREMLTEMQRDSILAEFRPKFEAAMAEARASDPEAPSPPKPRHLSDGTLLAEYERLAKAPDPTLAGAAAIRAKMLRERTRA